MIEESNPLNKENSKDSNLEKKGSNWIDNEDNEVDHVFGFNKNAELVNSRAAMIGFLLLILTELV